VIARRQWRRLPSFVLIGNIFLLPLQPPRPRLAVASPQVATAGFIGVVVDSIHGGPLAGAVVSVVGTALSTLSTRNGRFRIDSVPPGAYKLAVSHPLFDTLGFSPVTQSIELAAGHYDVVALGTPSARTLRRQLCPSADTAATPSFIVGRVRDADTGKPADGALVSMVYSTAVVTIAAGVRDVNRVRRVTAGADGAYVICGLASDLRGTLQAERGGARTAEVETALNGQIVALRSLSTGSADTAGARARDSLQRGWASVRGTVVDSSGAPISGANVAVAATAAATRTGSHGEFTLDQLPSGTQELVVKSVGFSAAAVPVELTMRETRSVTLRLARATPSLAPVVIHSSVDAGLTREGFFDRQKIGLGHFISPDDIAKAQPRVASDLLFLAPGFQVQHNSAGQTVILPPRSAYAEGASSCVNVFIDHTLWTSLAPGEFDSAVAARDIVAMETYSASFVPREFAVPGRSCVTIVVWSRARVGRL
jgi:protocatechuate 3,4-dioxygenase beta subunit